jgi:[ribosomal protein S18]-alanine N-acetyltransferase
MIRHATAADLPAIASIQAASPQAARWDPTDYLAYDVLVAVQGGQVAGFLVTRSVAEGEHEILNLAVAPEFRRCGIGRTLLERFMAQPRGSVFLEVRESNRGARDFYQSVGFKELTRRPQYYELPSEAAIVMKFHSC